MVGRIFVTVMIVLAMFIAFMACILSDRHLEDIVLFIKFFEVMLPVLGVAALIKYLCNK